MSAPPDDSWTALLMYPAGLLRWRSSPRQRQVDQQQEHVDEQDTRRAMFEEWERNRRHRIDYYATWSAPRLRHLGVIGLPRFKLPPDCDCNICRGTQHVERVQMPPDTSFVWQEDSPQQQQQHEGFCRAGACSRLVNLTPTPEESLT